MGKTVVHYGVEWQNLMEAALYLLVWTRDGNNLYHEMIQNGVISLKDDTSIVRIRVHVLFVREKERKQRGRDKRLQM